MIKISNGEASPQEVELYECLAKARYLSKRVAGKSKNRSDGSQCSVGNDIESAAAEYLASVYYDRPFNATISSKGDGGCDFSIPVEVEAIWLGADKVTGEPRMDGHLIVNPHEPQRWADVYVVVRGSIATGFEIAGWLDHNSLIKLPMKDFGYGPRYAARLDQLRTSDLATIRKEWLAPKERQKRV